MQFGYTGPDGTMLSLKYNAIQLNTEDGVLLSSRLHDNEGNSILMGGEKLIMHRKEGFLLNNPQAPIPQSLDLRIRGDESSGILAWVEFNKGSGTDPGILQQTNSEDTPPFRVGEPSLHDHWHSHDLKIIFKPLGGDGDCFLTNKRIILHRIADPWGDALPSLTIASIPFAIGKYMEGRWRKGETMRQFIELPLDEIVKIDQRYTYAYFLSDYQTGKCWIARDVMNHLIKTFEPREVSRETKGYGKKKTDIIYYIDPDEFKKEKLYDKRNMSVLKAMKYEAKGKKDKAIKEYQKALAVFPEDKFSQMKIDVLSGKPRIRENKGPITQKGETNASVNVSYSQERK